MAAVVKVLKTLLSASIGNGVADVTLDTELVNDLGLSAPQVDALVEGLEEAFLVDIHQAPTGPFNTVGDIVACVQSRLKH
jgi:acyl carrier protein